MISAWLGHVVRLVRAHGESRELAERASDDADRALGAQLANADTDVIPAVVADLPRRPRPYPVDEEWRRRFNFNNGGRA